MKRISRLIPPIIICLSFLISGCAPVDHHQARHFSDILNRYPGTDEPLRVPELSVDRSNSPTPAASPDVFILVHPAYSLFFRDEKRSYYTEAKYALLSKQFEMEERFIADRARSGKLLILIVPGNYMKESVAPRSYTSYLNRATAGGKNVFYLYSESASNGTIAMNEMVDLYRFLHQVRAEKILIGGGYIGRCQREFYNELNTYVDKSLSYLVPEISTISPDDISDNDAKNILDSIERHDYAPVRNFIDKKLDNAHLFSLPDTQF